MNSWTLKYETFADKPLNDLAIAIDKCKGTPLSHIKILDLVRPEVGCGHGVYVFKTSKRMYIGKVTSRSFIGRIPVHFDIGPDEWFHSFLKSCTKWTKEQAKRKTRNDYCIVLKKLMQENPHVIIIAFKEKKKGSDRYAASLETILQSSYRLNKKKQPQKRDILSKLVAAENKRRNDDRKKRQAAKERRANR